MFECPMRFLLFLLDDSRAMSSKIILRFSKMSFFFLFFFKGFVTKHKDVCCWSCVQSLGQPCGKPSLHHGDLHLQKKKKFSLPNLFANPQSREQAEQRAKNLESFPTAARKGGSSTGKTHQTLMLAGQSPFSDRRSSKSWRRSVSFESSSQKSHELRLYNLNYSDELIVALHLSSLFKRPSPGENEFLDADPNFA